jgi:hypothetical protein
MVDVLKTYGLDASWRPLVSKSYMKNGLIQGKVLMPVIGSLHPLWAHVMSLVAWDEARGWGFANTQFSHRNIHWISDQTLSRQWLAMVNLLVEVHNA